MSRKAKAIIFVVSVACVFLGVLIIAMLHTFQWLGCAISYIGIALLASVISICVQDAEDEAMEQAKLYCAKVDALCEMAKANKQEEKGGE